jgi:hypothetical protein
MLLVDGALFSRTAKKFSLRVHGKHDKDYKLSPESLLYELVLDYSIHRGYEKLVFNISHGRSQQCTHDFVRYVANKAGLVENTHYFMQNISKVNMFRLTQTGEKMIGVHQREDGLKYTHHLKKEPMRQDIIDAISGKGWDGELYLHSFYMNDAYPYLLELAMDNGIDTEEPFDLLEKIRSDQRLSALLSQKEFNWTKADGYVMGIEIDPF